MNLILTAGEALFRLIFLMLDWVVYTCLRAFYEIFIAISQMKLFSDGNAISEITDRLYVLIGVYALFKIIFVLINMIVSPSDGSKGEKSIGKLATRIFVMLAMIIVVPWIFEQAYSIQNVIIHENVIGKIILPEVYDNSEKDEDAQQAEMNNKGQKISNEIFSSFVSLSPLAMEDDTLDFSKPDEIDVETALNSDAKDKCAEPLQALMKLYGAADAGTDDTNVGVATIMGHITTTFEVSETEKKEFCIDYTIAISTLAGGFAAFIFAVYCLDIGVRVAKLAFYQLIAPIPIVTYIDGKKDGPFQKWMRDSLKTYADIFIRLIIINFVLLIITEVVPEIVSGVMFGETSGNMVTQFLAKAAIILGLLMFAKQAPQLFLDLFGIKAGNAFSFSPKAAQEKVAGGIGGTAVLAGAGAAGALIGGGAAALGKGVAGTAGGLVKGTFTKGSAADRGKAIKENITSSWKNAGIRGKASTVEALSRANTKNYSKGAYNNQVSGRDLARQAITGNVNATAGIGGRLASAQSRLTSSLSFETGAHKPKALSMTGKISAQLGNYGSTLNAQRLQLEEAARRGNAHAVRELSVATNFDAKSTFEEFLRSKGIDPTFQDIPNVNSSEWSDIATDYMEFENITDYTDKATGVTRPMTHAEKEKLKEYAEKALGDLKKEVDTLTKNK